MANSIKVTPCLGDLGDLPVLPFLPGGSSNEQRLAGLHRLLDTANRLSLFSDFILDSIPLGADSAPEGIERTLSGKESKKRRS